MDDAFEPLDADWTAVSPRLALVRRVIACSLLVLLGLLVAVPFVLSGATTWAVVPALAGVLLAVVAHVAIGRSVRSWAYAEREDDLLLRKGILVRRLTVVPYGRMQFVDVTADPVHRLAGLATVQLHTAAATTDAVIRGLPPQEAARLRDRLAARGEARAAGL